LKALLNVASFDLLSKLLLGILGILLIRYLRADEYATYTFSMSLVAFFTQSVASTFNRIYILTSPREGSGDALTVFGLQGLVILFLGTLGLPLAGEMGASYGLLITLVVATCASEFAKTLHQKDLDFARFSRIELARSGLFFFAAVVMLWQYGYSLTADQVILVQCLTFLLVALAAMYGRLGNIDQLHVSAVRLYVLKLLGGQHIYLFAYFFVVGIFTQTDIFILKFLGDDLMLATYGSAFRYYSVVSLGLAAVHTVLLPMIQHAKNIQELRAILDRHRRLVPLFGLATAIAAAGGYWVIPWVDMGRYPDAAATFSILCVSAMISFAFSPHVNLLMRMERFKFLLALVIAALSTHVVSSLVLVPFAGAIGAAVALLISSALITFSIFLYSRRLLLACSQT
jgi:O-antigen/teichoic acid export membrane protein